MARRRRHGEGTIGRRPDGRGWRAALSMGPGRPRRWFYGQTEDEVIAKLDRAKRAKRLGLGLEASRLRVGEWLEDWLERMESAGVPGPKTVLEYRGYVRRYLVPDVGRIRLSELTVSDVQDMLNRRRRSGLDARTVRHIRDILRNALNAAMREEMLGRNVAGLARPPALDDRDREAKFWSAKEARVFLEGSAGHRFRAIYLAGIGLGLRPSETLGLRWSDVDLDKGVLQVRQQLLRLPHREVELARVKSQKSKAALPLPPFIAAALREHRTAQLEHQLPTGTRSRWQLVFCDDHGQPWRLELVRKDFYRLLEQLGLPRIKLYEATRHTAAAILAAEKIHPKTAQRILRHANVETTLRIYTHVAPELEWEAAEAMERALGPG